MNGSLCFIQYTPLWTMALILALPFIALLSLCYWREKADQGTRIQAWL